MATRWPCSELPKSWKEISQTSPQSPKKYMRCQQRWIKRLKQNQCLLSLLICPQSLLLLPLMSNHKKSLLLSLVVDLKRKLEQRKAKGAETVPRRQATKRALKVTTLTVSASTRTINLSLKRLKMLKKSRNLQQTPPPPLYQKPNQILLQSPNHTAQTFCYLWGKMILILIPSKKMGVKTSFTWANIRATCLLWSPKIPSKALRTRCHSHLIRPCWCNSCSKPLNRSTKPQGDAEKHIMCHFLEFQWGSPPMLIQARVLGVRSLKSWGKISRTIGS